MGIASNIISVIIKSVVNSKLGDGLGSELIGIPIDEYSNIGVDKIKEFVDGEKLKIEHILSNENMKTMDVAEENIDFVVAELKDLLSKVEITDRVFRECKYSNENLKDFLWNEYRRDKDIIENESEIKKGLYVVAKTLIELMRESEKFEQDFLIQISNAVDDANVELQKISDYMYNNYGGMNEEIQMILVIVQMILEQIQNFGIEKQNTQKKIKSRTQEYADKWNANMFLNNFDEWDEKAGINVKLKDVYIEDHLPHFIWGDNKNESTNLNALLSQYIRNTGKNRMLLILGQPGIGKSTLITWIVNNFDAYIDDILVYQFASDLKDIDWKRFSAGYDLAEKILDVLNLRSINLEGKTLIFDGFDEINVGNEREQILNRIYWGLVEGSLLENFSLIITCRENYVSDLYMIKSDYIILQPWDEEQIESFCRIYQRKADIRISENMIANIQKNRKILGIPLILYMVLALNISIKKEAFIVDIYDQIFSLKEGGIYERCLYAEPHRIGVIRKQIHEISRKISIWMFENKAHKACIPKEEYQNICNDIMRESEQEDENIKQDFMIGNFFERVRHCEGIETEELYFVHRSIYEYFVAETIYSSIENAMIELSEESTKELAGNIAAYLKEGRITRNIGEYLLHKITKLYNNMDNKRKCIFYQWWEKTLEKMMTSGMFYYTDNIRYKNIIHKETVCFMNFIEILRLLQQSSFQRHILSDANKELVDRYFKYALVERMIYSRDFNFENLNFSKLCLRGINLSGVELLNVDLTGADLTKVRLAGRNLTKTILRQSILIDADLKQTDLRQVDLSGADLRRADLRKADLRGSDMRDVNLMGADLRETSLKGAYLNNLRNVNLVGVNLLEMDLIRVDLRKANLKKTNLKKSCLWGADLREADLRGTNLEMASLWSAKLDGSVWLEKDIKKVYSQYKYANFSYIIVERFSVLIRVSKEELLSSKWNRDII